MVFKKVFFIFWIFPIISIPDRKIWLKISFNKNIWQIASINFEKPFNSKSFKKNDKLKIFKGMKVHFVGLQLADPYLMNFLKLTPKEFNLLKKITKKILRQVLLKKWYIDNKNSKPILVIQNAISAHHFPVTETLYHKGAVLANPSDKYISIETLSRLKKEWKQEIIGNHRLAQISRKNQYNLIKCSQNSGNKNFILKIAYFNLGKVYDALYQERGDFVFLPSVEKIKKKLSTCSPKKNQSYKDQCQYTNWFKKKVNFHLKRISMIIGDLILRNKLIIIEGFENKIVQKKLYQILIEKYNFKNKKSEKLIFYSYYFGKIALLFWKKENFFLCPRFSPTPTFTRTNWRFCKKKQCFDLQLLKSQKKLKKSQPPKNIYPSILISHYNDKVSKLKKVDFFQKYNLIGKNLRIGTLSRFYSGKEPKIWTSQNIQISNIYIFKKYRWQSRIAFRKNQATTEPESFIWPHYRGVSPWWPLEIKIIIRRK